MTKLRHHSKLRERQWNRTACAVPLDRTGANALRLMMLACTIFSWIDIRIEAAPPSSIEILQQEQDALRAAGDFAQRSVVQIETFGGREVVGDSAVAAGPSSGTIVDSDGWIITSLFQFRGDPASITVLLPDGQRKAAKLVARDHARELGLLKIDVEVPLISAIPSDRTKWEIGQWTIALGKTFDIVTASRSVGVLSAIDRIFGRAIQTDCKISPHNYGGPLIDIYGRTMGVLAPIDPGIATEGEVQQWYDSGIGFAVPLDDILKRLPKMMKGEDIYPGKAGIRPAFNDDFRGPVVLAGVVPGTPAAKTGLKAGDTLLKIGSSEIRWPNHMRHAFGSIDAGETITMTIERSGETQSFDCTLVKELPVYRMPFVGVLPDPSFEGPGVRIRAVAKDSPAEKALMKAGQVIRKLGTESIASIEDLQRNLSFVDYREPATFELTEVSDKPAKGKEQATQMLTVQLTPWRASENPKASEVEASTPIAIPNSKEKRATGVVELPMGDVKNQAFAFVPSTYHASHAHGVLLLAAEPGKIDRKAWVDRWEQFCRDHRFILAIVGSASPEAWTMEELQILKRVLQLVRADYKVDSRRIVVGGIGAGSGPAMVLALQNRATFRGLWVAGGNIPRGLRMPQAEPMESMSILFSGSNPAYPLFADRVEKMGYRVLVSPEKFDIAGLLTGNLLQQQAQSFFASLEWL
jgi:serine protease Do